MNFDSNTQISFSFNSCIKISYKYYKYQKQS